MKSLVLFGWLALPLAAWASGSGETARFSKPEMSESGFELAPANVWSYEVQVQRIINGNQVTEFDLRDHQAITLEAVPSRRPCETGNEITEFQLPEFLPLHTQDVPKGPVIKLESAPKF